VTARGISRILIWAKKQTFAGLWVDAMAKPGAGTLANRLENSTFRGKTGTLNKVVSLSGYCKLKSGQDVVVSVIVNHYIGPSATARNVADAFVRKVEEGTGFGTKRELGAAYGHFVPNKVDRRARLHWLP
jgi:D-alanyl-D-alanine carboxypeptidase